MTAWRFKAGRVHEHEYGTCSQVIDGAPCGKPAPYRIRATMGDGGTPNDKMRCTNCAAGTCFRLGLPFPTGMWRD